MNERIKLLAEQAGSSRLEYNPVTMMTERIQEFDKEKFAELIIKECTLQIADVRIEHDFDPTVDEVLVQALTGIKKHFGVEL